MIAARKLQSGQLQLHSVYTFALCSIYIRDVQPVPYYIQSPIPGQQPRAT
jgi:hypothetical protein